MLARHRGRPSSTHPSDFEGSDRELVTKLRDDGTDLPLSRSDNGGRRVAPISLGDNGKSVAVPIVLVTGSRRASRVATARAG